MNDRQSKIGIIYVLKNKSMQGFYKIGITQRDIHSKIAELSNNSGVSDPFELVYGYPVGNCKEAEKALHKAFDKQGWPQNKEFFKINPHDIKPLIEFISKSTTMNNYEEINPRSFRQNSNLVARTMIENSRSNLAHHNSRLKTSLENKRGNQIVSSFTTRKPFNPYK